MTVSPYKSQTMPAVMPVVQKHVFGTATSTQTPQEAIKTRLNSLF